MIVQVDIPRMIVNELTVTQYVLIELLRNKKDKLLKRIKLIDPNIKADIKVLKARGYILKIDRTGYIINQKLCSELLDLEESNFWELFGTYPLKVNGGGQIRVLRNSSPDAQEAKKALLKYKSKVKTKTLHDHVMACLNMELKMRKKEKSLGYMQQLSTWLNQNAWEKYECFVDQVGMLNLEDTERYGEELV